MADDSEEPGPMVYKFAAFRREIRLLGECLAGASDDQADALLPELELALASVGSDPNQLLKALSNLRRAVENMEPLSRSEMH